MYAKTALGLVLAAYAANEASGFSVAPSSVALRLRPTVTLRSNGRSNGVADSKQVRKGAKHSAKMASGETDASRQWKIPAASSSAVASPPAPSAAAVATVADPKPESVPQTPPSTEPSGARVLPDEVFDLIVIGGGPAGLTAALTAADVGKSVAIVDGTPTKQVQFSGPTGLFSKALRDSAKKVKVKTLREMGLLDSSIWNQVETLTYDILNASGRRNLAAIQGAQVPTVRGTAVLFEDDDPDYSTVLIKRNDGVEEKATCRKLLIATGSSPMRVKGVPYDDIRCFDSDSIRALKFLPKSVVIVGSGIIAIEYAKIFNYLETKVTLVIRAKSFEGALSRIGVDPDVAANLQSDLLASGVDIFLDAEIDSFEMPDDTNKDLGISRDPMKIAIKKSSTGEVAFSVDAEVLMTATGRVANTRGLGLEEAGVELDRGKIVVKPTLESSVEGVFAAGDVVGAPSLASTGIEQGAYAVKKMFEQDDTVEGTWMDIDPNQGKDPESLTQNPLQYPIGIWTLPEMSFIGYNKESAEKAGFENVAEGVAYYENTIRGRVQGVKLGLLKLVFQKPSGRILGVHILGDDACELIHYGTALAQSGKTVRQVLGTTFAAVTFHELFGQAASDACVQLDADMWYNILKGIGLDENSCLLQSGIEEGLLEAGMNARHSREIAHTFDGVPCIALEDALEVVKQYRVPGKYRMAQALKDQFASTDDDAKFRAAAEKMFKAMDVDGGGSINKDELIEGLAKRGLVLSAAAADDLMTAIDEDGSGEVDFDEFFVVLQNLVKM